MITLNISFHSLDFILQAQELSRVYLVHDLINKLIGDELQGRKSERPKWTDLQVRS